MSSHSKKKRFSRKTILLTSALSAMLVFGGGGAYAYVQVENNKFEQASETLQSTEDAIKKTVISSEKVSLNAEEAFKVSENKVTDDKKRTSLNDSKLKLDSLIKEIKTYKVANDDRDIIQNDTISRKKQHQELILETENVKKQIESVENDSKKWALNTELSKFDTSKTALTEVLVTANDVLVTSEGKVTDNALRVTLQGLITEADASLALEVDKSKISELQTINQKLTDVKAALDESIVNVNDNKTLWEENEKVRFEAEQEKLKLAEEKRERENSQSETISPESKNSSKKPSPVPSEAAPAPVEQESAPAPAPVPSGAPTINDVALAEAGRWGVTLKWMPVTSNGVKGHVTENSINVAGLALGNAPGVIELSVGDADIYSVTKEKFNDVIRKVVRHEASHVAIMNICGTFYPPISGDRGENVTDAYSSLFLDGGPNSGGYGFNENDADIANKIKAGQCS